MNQHQLIKFLNRVHVWIPRNNPMRKELKAVVTMLGGNVSEVMSDEEWKEKYVVPEQQQALPDTQ